MYNSYYFDTKDRLFNLYKDKLLNFLKEYKYMDARELSKGEGIKISLLDTGVDFTHPDLKNRIKGGYNVVINSPNDYIDNIGHGTCMAGLIVGRVYDFLPNSEFYAIKVTDDDGRMVIETIIDGIKWSINNDIDVICIPIGMYEESEKLKEVIDIAHEQGIIMVCAAGNNSSFIDYPAKYKETICVGSIDFLKKSPNFASIGRELDIVMPSVNIPSLYCYGKYMITSGTSIATAFATVYIVLLQSLALDRKGRKLTLDEIREIFEKHSVDLGEVGFDETYGYGIPTFLEIL